MFKDIVMSKEVAILVATIVNQKELLGTIEKEDKEEVHMCTSITQALMQREFKGKKIGTEIGTKIGKVTILMAILQTRFGTLSKELEKSLEECNDEQLDLLAIHIFDIHSEEDFIKLI
mgnify:CR=1 FL=1